MVRLPGNRKIQARDGALVSREVRVYLGNTAIALTLKEKIVVKREKSIGNLVLG